MNHTQDNVQTFATHFPKEYVSSHVNLNISTIPCPWKQIYIIIDCSGSTDNTLRSTRGMATNTTEEPKLQSKIIAIAQLEGISRTIAELTNKYNMTGTAIVLHSFGSSIYKCLLPNSQYVVTTNENLQNELLNNLDKLIVYDGGGTALLPALREVFSICKLNSMLVIATDGQPNTEGNTETVCIYMKQELQKESCPITCLIAIGAGSIQENQHMFYGNRASHVFSKNDSCDERDKIRKAIADMNDCHRECNNLFLLNLAELAIEGIYCPACTDYSELSTTLQEYFNGTHVAKYKTILDNNKFGDLLPFVNHTFSTMPERKAVIVNTLYGYYFITRDRQISVSPVVPHALDSFTGITIKDILPSFEVLLLPFDITFSTYCTMIRIPTLVGDFEVNCDSNGYPRMRKVLLI